MAVRSTGDKPKKTTYVMSSRDVAHVLDMSPDDVILLARKGALKSKKIGRRWKFQMKDVDAYVKKRDKKKE